MGDRANIVVRQKDDGPLLFLYTHWGGHGLPQSLQSGLNLGQGRWKDPAYLTRRLFNVLQGQDRGETGWGISIVLCDNEHDYLLVNIPAELVELHAYDGFDRERLCHTVRGNWQEPLRTWSFEEFIEIEDISWEKIAKGTDGREGKYLGDGE